MIVQKFTYRAPQLREPLKLCIEFIKEKRSKILDEVNKDKQHILDFRGASISSDIRNRISSGENKIRNLSQTLRRYEIFLNEVNNRGWFTKYTMDENDLSDLYQYLFQD